MGEQKRRPGGTTIDRSRASRSAITVVIIILCIVIIGVVEYIYQSKSSPLAAFDPARTKGNPDAPLQILEFVDFQCPECAKAAKLLKRYMEDYPAGIFLAVKYYPLGELNSMPGAVYGECAARQGKFWPMHDLLFDRLPQWRTLKDVRPFFNVIAKDVGLDIKELDHCLADDDVPSVIAAERITGESHFVRSTPTYFINGDIVVGVDALRETLEKFFDDQTEEFL